MDTELVIALTGLVVSVCTGIVGVLAAIGALLVSWKGWQENAADNEKKEVKLEHISSMVNSQLTQALERVASASGEIAALRRSVALMTGEQVDLDAAQDAEVKAEMDSKTNLPKLPGSGQK